MHVRPGEVKLHKPHQAGVAPCTSWERRLRWSVVAASFHSLAKNLIPRLGIPIPQSLGLIEVSQTVVAPPYLHNTVVEFAQELHSPCNCSAIVSLYCGLPELQRTANHTHPAIPSPVVCVYCGGWFSCLPPSHLWVGAGWLNVHLVILFIIHSVVCFTMPTS